jgi:hypothetical protein
MGKTRKEMSQFDAKYSPRTSFSHQYWSFNVHHKAHAHPSLSSFSQRPAALLPLIGMQLAWFKTTYFVAPHLLKPTKMLTFAAQ